MKKIISSTILLTLLFALLPNAYAGKSGEDLFASGDFSSWANGKGNPVGDGWQIEKGVVGRIGTKPGSIFTKEKYSDFDLTFEWKISEGGNSGIKYRCNGGLGLEYQVLDDARHKDGRDADHRSAALYDLVPAPDDKPVKKVGQWNSGRIVVKGNHVEHWLNGKKLLEIEIGSKDWDKRFQASKYTKHEGFGTWIGPIQLQDHGDKVWYRNVRIKRL